MKRRDLIKGLGALGIASMIPLSKTTEAFGNTAMAKTYKGKSVCWLTPEKTEGPYYFNANLVRPDIRYDTQHSNEFHDGIVLNMTFTVIDINCNPIPNVLVDIWCCDKDGHYSGYNQPGGNFIGYDFMRGIQVTDANGVCTFKTSYPGWYTGRATHIHFKVRLNSTTYVTSQFCFPDATNNTIYDTPLYTAHGHNPITNANDMVFGTAEPQYLTVYPVVSGSEYNAPYTIGVNGATGINNNTTEANGFSLEQNYPNPFNPSTMISYTIPKTEKVTLEIWDVLGNKVSTLVNVSQSAGRYSVNFDASNLSSGFYFYKLIAGEFIQAKEMLLIK